MDFEWHYKVCEYCLKNAHEKVEMERTKIFSTVADNFEEMWICPKCGSTKKL